MLTAREGAREEERNREEQQYSQKSIITLNVKGLNSPIKRHCGWIGLATTKKDPSILCLQETYLRCKDTHRKCRDVKRFFHANRTQKKAGVAIRLSDKLDF